MTRKFKAEKKRIYHARSHNRRSNAKWMSECWLIPRILLFLFNFLSLFSQLQFLISLQLFIFYPNYRFWPQITFRFYLKFLSYPVYVWVCVVYCFTLIQIQPKSACRIRIWFPCNYRIWLISGFCTLLITIFYSLNVPVILLRGLPLNNYYWWLLFTLLRIQMNSW